MTRKRLICLIVIFLVTFCARAVNCEQKPSYLVLVSRKVDKMAFNEYVSQRQSKFNVIVLSLEELGVLNNVTGIKSAIKKLDYPKGTYLAIDKRVKALERIKVVDRYVEGQIDETKETEVQSLAYLWENFNVGIIDPLIEIPCQKKEKIAITSPIVSYNRYTIGICCDTGVTEYSQKFSDVAKNRIMPTDTFFETRSSYTLGANPTFPINEFQSKIGEYGIIYIANTFEPISVFGGMGKWEFFEHKFPTTAIWTDKDSNKHVDNYNAEIQTEQYWDGAGFSGLLISDTINPDYDGICITRNDYYATDSAIIGALLTELENGSDISVAVQKLYKVAEIVAQNNPNCYFKETFVAQCGLTWIVYGPPEITLFNFIKTPEVFLQQNALELEQPTTIDLGFSSSSMFAIRNQGESVLEWDFIEIPDWISISPKKGKNDIGTETEVELNIKTIIDTIDIQTTPREKIGILILKTNDPRRKEIRIRVIAKGIFPSILLGIGNTRLLSIPFILIEIAFYNIVCYN